MKTAHLRRLAPLVFTLFPLSQIPASNAPESPLTSMAPDSVVLADGTVFIDAEKALNRIFGPNLSSLSEGSISPALESLAESLPAGGAIDLPRSVPCGSLDFRRVADNVQITGGHGGSLMLGAGQKGIQILFAALDQTIDKAPDRGSGHASPSAIEPKDVAMFDPKAAPASDLLALFCDGGIHIKTDVRHCAWIAGANSFGAHTVTADARVDDSLFLWFGMNWPFSDYNAFRDPNKKGKDWLANAQMTFDCHGGGQGTRLYLMVETNYGNPGPGVVLQNCDGMALYHGSSERGSAQGPGLYWLKDCRNVKLGLRGINAYYPPTGPKAPAPTHDITIEGGNGNILHCMRAWGYASQESAVNSDPALQVWMTAFQHETKGFDAPGVLRFAFTPDNDKPEPVWFTKEVEPKLKELTERILRDQKLEMSPENLKTTESAIRTGRYLAPPLNATFEQTFWYGPDDLTKNPAKLSNGQKLPPPPSMPATNAPRVRAPIAFTQAPDFGKALLDAGADPTGKRPSDDAFAQLMYGMNRADLEKLLKEAAQGDSDYRTAHHAKDEAGEKTAKARIEAAVKQMMPAESRDDAKHHPKRPQIQVPPGTFLLEHPLLLAIGNNALFGAGPEKTVLVTRKDIKVVEMHLWGTVANLSIEGGRVGLAITGPNHEEAVSPTIQSYVAGSNFYNITFRNQTFAGMHVGNDDINLMGGSEFDQNRFVDVQFIHTGDYGIYMNLNMVDKWLFLHGKFEGQKKAGISAKYNNIIHGAFIDTVFKNIDGPALDFLGGNPTIAYRPWCVMVDQCDFEECGNASAPAVDQGYGEIMSFTRCRIHTRNKTIKAGYAGSAQIYEDDEIDAKVPEGSPAIVLRAVRQVLTARANGHTLRGVKASGPVAFVNDANSENELFRHTLDKYGKPPEAGKPPEIPWDTNPAAHELAPKNGWVHPFIMYNCQFGEKKYAYSLLNVDPDHGKILEEVDLAHLAGQE